MADSDKVRDTAIAIAVGVVSFIVYAAGASRSIYVGDSGELATAVATLGIPHPSGYPLYVLLGKLWTAVVPVGTVAFRLSLFSAAAAALACALMYRLARRLGVSVASALLAATLLAASESFWSQANIQRVYALNAVFVVLATGAALSWYRLRSAGAFGLTCFVCALGATSHTFMGAYGLAFAMFAFACEPAIVSRLGYWLRGIAGVAVGVSPYLYLPIRSRMNPPLDWGNPETAGALADVILRRSFWERAWLESPADAWLVARDFAASVPAELTAAGALLAVFGAVYGISRNRFLWFPLIVLAGNVCAVAWHGSRSDIFIWHRYYIPAYAMSALFAGIGWQAASQKLPSKLRGIALFIPVLLVVANYARFDRSRFRVAEDYATAVFESVPPGAHLAASDDNVLFALLYLHWVEGMRPDVNLVMQGVGKAELPPLRFDPDNDPLFFTHHPNWSIPQIVIEPLGLVFQVRRAEAPPGELKIVRTEIAGMNDPRVPKDYLTQNLIGQFHFMTGATFERRDWPRARAAFDEAATASPDNDVLFYNLGLIYVRNGLYDEAIEAFERSAQINPRHIPGRSRSRASDRILEARAERQRIARIEEELPDGVADEDLLAIADYLESKDEIRAAHGYRLGALERERTGSGST